MLIPRYFNSNGTPQHCIHFARMHVPTIIVQPWDHNMAKRRCNDEFNSNSNLPPTSIRLHDINTSIKYNKINPTLMHPLPQHTKIDG